MNLRKRLYIAEKRDVAIEPIALQSKKVMKENTEQIIKYLFGELDEQERNTLEDRIFADEDFALFLNAVEKDLIDDYARNEMDSALQRRFEQKYLISETRREKVQTAMILQNELFAEKEAVAPIVVQAQPTFWEKIAAIFRVPNLALAGGLAAVLILILFSWILFRKSPSAPEIVKDRNENLQIHLPTPQISPTQESNIQADKNSNVAENANKPENKETNKPEAKPTNSPTEKPEKREIAPPEPRVFMATLLPITRSGETPVLTIPKNAENVQLRIVHDNLQPFKKYRAEIRNSNGEAVFVREIPLTSRNFSRPIALNIKNSALKTGSYELILSGITDDNQTEEIKFYNFTVRQK